MTITEASSQPARQAAFITTVNGSGDFEMHTPNREMEKNQSGNLVFRDHSYRKDNKRKQRG